MALSMQAGSTRSRSISQFFNEKALTPNDFPSLAALKERILGFQQYYEQIAKPFEWKFTRKDLNRLMCKI
jgi:hypothetical protein